MTSELKFEIRPREDVYLTDNTTVTDNTIRFLRLMDALNFLEYVEKNAFLKTSCP